jgi:hypothetical protein
LCNEKKETNGYFKISKTKKRKEELGFQLDIMDDIQCNLIYGVDITKEITPIMVRDAIIDCFYKAHSADLENIKELINFKSQNEFEEFKREEVLCLIKSKFEEVNGDFNYPTKEILTKVELKLKDYSKFFRDKKIIEKHAGEIMELINKLE